MEEINSDTRKFRKLNDDPVTESIRRENKLKNFLRGLKENETISGATYEKLFLTGSRPGVLYGLSKVHKTDVPLRPILPAINTLAHRPSKLLVLLRPISSGLYTESNPSFVQELLTLNYDTNNFTMASFDIKFLFTKIPLDETIDIIVSELFNKSTHFQNFTRKEFITLLRFAVKDCQFLFNSVLYEGTDGVAMGSVPGPVFAEILLNHHERTWLANCPSHFKPAYYRRYVDDCFLLFRSPSHGTRNVRLNKTSLCLYFVCFAGLCYFYFS